MSAFTMPVTGAEDHRVLDHHVGRVVAVGAGGAEALAVAHELARAGGQLFAVVGEILLDLDQQRGIAEPHEIAGGGAVVGGVLRARHLHFR